MRELGKRIRKRRLLLGLSLKQIAAAANRSHGWLLNVERGIGNPPSEALTAIAVALGDDPKEYLRLAGRVSLTAADVTPLTRPELPAGMTEAIGQALAAQLEPLIARIEAQLPPDREIVVSDEIRVQDGRGQVTEYQGPRAPTPAPVAPIPTLRVRRKHWLELARHSRGFTVAELDDTLGRRGQYALWRDGKTDPKGAQVRALAEKLDIPEALIINPPATDEERLSRWRFTDGDSVLREAL